VARAQNNHVQILLKSTPRIQEEYFCPNPETLKDPTLCVQNQDRFATHFSSLPQRFPLTAYLLGKIFPDQEDCGPKQAFRSPCVPRATYTAGIGLKQETQKERSIGWMRRRKEADDKKEKKRTCSSTGNSVKKLGSLLLRHIDSREEDQTNSFKVDCWQ
jgi:hypothetical protein